MKVGFLGDIHCDITAAKFMLWSMRRVGVSHVIQVGDFGIYSDKGGVKFAKVVDNLCEEYGISLLVVPGNHENHDIINYLTGSIRTELAEYRKNILVAPRGYRWIWGSSSFVALGGAPSVDRAWRVKADRISPDRANKLWYDEEFITPEDVEYVSEGGYADVMVGHDAPRGVSAVDNAIAGNPFGFHPADLLYAESGRDVYDTAFRAVSPALCVHGHYHVPGLEDVRRPGGEYGDKTTVLSLGCEIGVGSMATYDTESKTVSVLDTEDFLKQYYKEN